MKNKIMDETKLTLASFLSFKQMYINKHDFLAVLAFEKRHPDIFMYEDVPVDCNMWECMMLQIATFNFLFEDQEYGQEFKNILHEIQNGTYKIK